jgi:hypothetical protein
MLIANPKGNYSFLKGIPPYSGGAVAMPGYAIDHARLMRPVPWKQGFAIIEDHLKSLGRPRTALAGVELRSPKPFTFGGFNAFNGAYIEMLKSWDLFENDLNPVARTNVAPKFDAPADPALYGFSYTVKSEIPRKTFVVAGGGELPEGSLDPHDVIRRGETSPDALREKARFVMGLMDGRVKALGASWDDAIAVNVYTVFNLGDFWEQELLARMSRAKEHGVVWFPARPPIESIEFEMDLHGWAREIVLS